MLIVQVDPFNAQALQTSVARTAHILGPAIHADDGPAGISHCSELCCNENAIAFSFEPASN